MCQPTQRCPEDATPAKKANRLIMDHVLMSIYAKAKAKIAVEDAYAIHVAASKANTAAEANYGKTSRDLDEALVDVERAIRRDSGNWT